VFPGKEDVVKTRRVILWIGFLFYVTGFCHGQILPDDFVLFGGVGAANQSGGARQNLHLGAGLNWMKPMGLLDDRLASGLFLELGYAGPFRKLGSGSAVFSANYTGGIMATEFLMPFATIGYSRIFKTGNALNYGGGLDYMLDEYHFIRFEARNYVRRSGAKEKDLAFRIGYIFYLGDYP
jgi:hypothetical protein